MKLSYENQFSRRREPEDFKTLNIERGDPLEVKDSWFEAYKPGNFGFPQTNILIRVEVGLAVLKDPPRGWESFQNSRLDDIQKEKLGHIMSAIHAKLGIPHTTLAHKALFALAKRVFIVSDKRISRLWDTPRNHTLNSLWQLIKLVDPSKGTKSRDLDPKEMDEFFLDPENQRYIKKIVETLEIVSEAFKHEDIKDYLRRYKENLPAHQKTKTVQPFMRSSVREVRQMLANELIRMNLDLNDPLVLKILGLFGIYEK